MSYASVFALVMRNAKACEEARHPACRCHCGGAQHGRAHSRAWVQSTALRLSAELDAERSARRPRDPQADLFGGPA